MKFLLLLALCALAYAAPRQKRLTVGTISVTGLGGSTGCVVTGDKLFINGIFSRQLKGDEKTEFDNYVTKLNDYKKAVNDFQEARKAAFQARRNGIEESTNMSKDLPKVPEKPSFCSAEETTQYVFDGCIIQGNKVYVGREFARDLSPSEIEQLKEFDVKQTAYQNVIQSQMQQEMKNMFGTDLFSNLFGSKNTQVTSTVAPTSVDSTAIPPKPDVPNFCTAVY